MFYISAADTVIGIIAVFFVALFIFTVFKKNKTNCSKCGKCPYNSSCTFKKDDLQTYKKSACSYFVLTLFVCWFIILNVIYLLRQFGAII